MGQVLNADLSREPLGVPQIYGLGLAKSPSAMSNSPSEKEKIDLRIIARIRQIKVPRHSSKRAIAVVNCMSALGII